MSLLEHTMNKGNLRRKIAASIGATPEGCILRSFSWFVVHWNLVATGFALHGQFLEMSAAFGLDAQSRHGCLFQESQTQRSRERLLTIVFGSTQFYSLTLPSQLNGWHVSSCFRFGGLCKPMTNNEEQFKPMCENQAFKAWIVFVYCKVVKKKYH